MSRALLAVLAAEAVLPTPCFGVVSPDVVAVRLASGLSRPVFLTSPPDDPERLLIVEQHTGQIRILHRATGQLNVEPFLTIDGLATGNEQGLLGLALHPGFPDNGYFYVYLTVAGTGESQIWRLQVSASNPDIADPESGQPVLSFSQPFQNHNGGWMGFGPDDGYLYIATGDGGSANDPQGNAQSFDVLLGKMLRIDVDGDDFPGDATANYAIPATNPFVGSGGREEIWAYGLRNPWRDSFDPVTGDLFIGDVGQGAWEEIDYQPGLDAGGENYGWVFKEGTHCTSDPPIAACSDSALVDPVHEYAHGPAPDGGFAVTGGYVYRGPISELDGLYFFADYATAQIWSFAPAGGSPIDFTNWTAQLTPPVGTIDQVSSFGEDAQGNLYLIDLGGEIFKLVQTSSDACDGDTVALQDWTAPTTEPRVCTATHSLSTGDNVSLPSGAEVYFTAPEVVLGPGLAVAQGAVLAAGPL